jgi:phosphatidylglycerol:prolipoprotein diacylglycerol transferase
MAGIFIATREAKRLNVAPQIILDIAVYIIIGAIVGARLFFVATRFSYYKDNPLDVFKIWEGGLVFYGGFILALIVCAWFIKRNNLKLWQTFDIFAPALAIGVFFGRLGCFFAGCCFGKACKLPWAVTFSDPQSLAVLNTPLHPTQLYSVAGSLFTFIIIYSLRKRKSFDGQLAMIWVFMYSGLRSIIEFYRGDIRGAIIFGQFPVTQVIAFLFAFSSMALFIVLKVRSSRKV